MIGVVEGFYGLCVYVYGFLDFVGGCIVLMGSNIVNVSWFGLLRNFWYIFLVIFFVNWFVFYKGRGVFFGLV